MATVEEKLEVVESSFRYDSKRYHAARYIVKLDHQILDDEKKAIIKTIPIAPKTLQALIRKLKTMGLYPPQKTSEISDRLLNIEKPQESSHLVPKVPQPPLEYVTKEDFEAQFEKLRNSTKEDLETIRTSITGLSSLMNRDPSPNPVEDEEEDIEVIPPGGMIPPGEGIIRDPSLTVKQVHIKPKTWMYFDMARQGVFANYADSRELGPFTQFDGDISDFFNVLADDYFLRNYNADIGLTMRRYVR